MELNGRVRNYWNEIGPTKSFAHPIDVETLKRWVQPDSRILDYGCGYGRAVGILAAAGFKNLMGLDPAPAMIAAAHRNHPSIAFDVLTDPSEISLPDASVDALLLIAVLTCIPESTAQRRTIAGITRVLRPGGILYVSDMGLQTDARNLERYARGEAKYGVYGVFDLDEGITVRHHHSAWIESLLSDYEVLVVKDVEAQTMNGNAAKLFQLFARRASANVGTK
jgi:SAM-dependent methyltransferase